MSLDVKQGRGRDGPFHSESPAVIPDRADIKTGIWELEQIKGHWALTSVVWTLNLNTPVQRLSPSVYFKTSTQFISVLFFCF